MWIERLLLIPMHLRATDGVVRLLACVSFSMWSVACAPVRADLCWAPAESRGTYLPRSPAQAKELISLAEASSKEPLGKSQFWFRGQDTLSLCTIPLDCEPHNCTAQRFDYRWIKNGWKLIESSEIVNVAAEQCCP
jgi:hypothetical protein